MKRRGFGPCRAHLGSSPTASWEEAGSLPGWTRLRLWCPVGGRGSAVPVLDSSGSCWQHFWENRCKLLFNHAGICCLLPSPERRSNGKYWPGCRLRPSPDSQASPLPCPAEPSAYLIPRKPFVSVLEHKSKRGRGLPTVREARFSCGTANLSSFLSWLSPLAGTCPLCPGRAWRGAGSLDLTLLLPAGCLSSSVEEGFHRGSAHVVPCALLHHQPAAEGEAAGAGERWGASPWLGTLSGEGWGWFPSGAGSLCPVALSARSC